MHHAAMTINQDAPTANVQRQQRLMAAGGLVGALAASSCCILPLLLFSLGVSGAWIGNLTRLAPYQRILSRLPSLPSATATGSSTAHRRSPAPAEKPVDGHCRTASSRPDSFWQRRLSLPRSASTFSQPSFSAHERR